MDITASEAAALLQGPESDGVVLLDVREDVELTLATVADAVHIPMGQIPERLGELDRDKTIICMCHSGGRSMQVAQYLDQQGFPSVRNLAGGIGAWSRDIDPSIPEY